MNVAPRARLLSGLCENYGQAGSRARPALNATGPSFVLVRLVSFASNIDASIKIMRSSNIFSY